MSLSLATSGLRRGLNNWVPEVDQWPIVRWCDVHGFPARFQILQTCCMGMTINGRWKRHVSYVDIAYAYASIWLRTVPYFHSDELTAQAITNYLHHQSTSLPPPYSS